MNIDTLTPDELARELVKCEQWRVMEGMCAAEEVGDEGDPDRVVRLVQGEFGDPVLAVADSVDAARCSPTGFVPDITDPATAGCLLDMLKDSDCPHIRIRFGRRGEWGVEASSFKKDLGSEHPTTYHAQHLALGIALASVLLKVWRKDNKQAQSPRL